MKVSLHPSDNSGCGAYRMRYPAMAAQAAGVEVEIVDQRPPVTFIEHNGGIGVKARDPEVDVVVLQRVFSRHVADLIPILHELGQAVVVEIDDDLTCIPAAHPCFGQFHPDRDRDLNWRHLQRACAQADLVTVPSAALADRYGAHGRVAVLPNRVPEALLDMPRSSDGRTVGWGGWALVHPGDLESCAGGVQQALDQSGWSFKVIGPGEGVRKALCLREEPAATGGMAIEDYYAALGSLDLGVLPLADIRFNSGKGHKGLELAARGTPFVASPVGHYPHLASQGVGLIASSRARNWRSALGLLMGDESYRAEMAERGRSVVAEHHTYERNGHLWAQAWERALANYKQRCGLTSHFATPIGSSA